MSMTRHGPGLLSGMLKTGFRFRYKSTSSTTATAESIIASAVDAEKQLVQDMFEAEESPIAVRTEEELLALRNKSRLKPAHRARANGESMDTTPSDPVTWFHHTVKWKRRMYAKYGEASGINPGLQWPTTQDLEKRKEYESVAYPFTLHEMMDTVTQRKQAERQEFERRTKELDDNMSKLDKAIQDVLNKRAQKERELQKNQERKMRLVEEVRRHFGFTVDPRDDRFKEMLEKKEKEEKKKMKEARKLEKQEKLMKKLMDDSARIGLGTKTSNNDNNKEGEEKETFPTKGPTSKES